VNGARSVSHVGQRLSGWDDDRHAGKGDAVTHRFGSRRLVLGGLVVALGALGWATRAVVEAVLAGGGVVDLGPLQLRLLLNPGVAFSVGAGLPTGVVVAVTGLVVLLVAGYAWRVAPDIPMPGLVGLAAVLAGAVTNLADRLPDGTVTDYLHTGWFATFNVPDVLISAGALRAAVVLATMQKEQQAR
jgi:signal peptidase II